FYGKPGDPQRRPPQLAPYHLRLDWAMWFCAISPSYRRSWLGAPGRARLRNDRHVVRLLRHNPFPDEPPSLVHARSVRYWFGTRAQGRESGVWWIREPVGDLIAPTTLRDLS